MVSAIVKGLSTVRVAMLRFLLPRLARPRKHEPPVCCILDSNVLGTRGLDRIRNQRARRFERWWKSPLTLNFPFQIHATVINTFRSTGLRQQKRFKVDSRLAPLSSS